MNAFHFSPSHKTFADIIKITSLQDISYKNSYLANLLPGVQE